MNESAALTLMPTATRTLFEKFIEKPGTLSESEMKQLADYIAAYGRLKVLNAVPESHSHHLDALTEQSR